MSFGYLGYGMMRAVDLTTGHDDPSDPRGFVGHGDGNQLVGLACQQTGDTQGYLAQRLSCSPPHGPRTTAHGPLLQRRKTGLTDGFPVTRFMLFEQTVAHQKRDATRAHFDRRNHCHTP